ncbi:hypothetical protein TrLO_g7720 [Triparma laevis f. longispina]|uniref:WD40 repeat-like protein n=1 Tax=Triparma laevis f. longispina TaxID=1714387 RepID=A0A9W7EF91_9STRA|nr:hypothetical protein TrLO_g7720 [Triparma laevis f. longispina]
MSESKYADPDPQTDPIDPSYKQQPLPGSSSYDDSNNDQPSSESKLDPENDDDSTSTDALPPNPPKISPFTDFSNPPTLLQPPTNSRFHGSLTTDTSTSCDLLTSKDTSTQAIMTSSSGVQVDFKADAEHCKPIKKHCKEDKKDDENDDYDDDDYEEEKGGDENADLLNFLKKVAPGMLDELRSNLESQAFDNVEKDWGGIGSSENTVDHLHSLTLDWSKIEITAKQHNNGSLNDFGRNEAKINTAAEEEIPGLETTGVAWNATGAIIIATFGLLNNPGWCNSRGALAAWNLTDRNFSSRKPSVFVEHSSHLMCVIAHPVKPAVFVAGSFNGEILVYDTSLPSPLTAASKIDDYFHREPISSLSFVPDPVSNGSYVLVSVSGDGKVLFWDIDKLKAPTRGVMVLKESKENSPRLGGSALATQGEGGGDLWVGSEGGRVVRVQGRDKAPAKPGKMKACDMKWSTNALQAIYRVPAHQRDELIRLIEKRAKSDKRRGVDLSAIYAARPPFSSIFPVGTVFSYRGHEGRVGGIDCSSFSKKVFATGGSDGEVHVYNMLSKDPIRVLEGRGAVSAVKWSKTRSSILAWAGEGGVVVSDVINGEETTLSPAWKEPTSTNSSSNDDENLDDAPPAPSTNSIFSSLFKPATFSSLAFNGKVRNLIAAGDANGVVHVWRLPQDLVGRTNQISEEQARRCEERSDELRIR